MTKSESGAIRRFDWIGIAQNGTQLKGEIHATSDMRARVALRQRGITPIKIERPWRWQARLSSKTISLILLQMRTDLQMGSSLAQSMQQHPAVFDALTCTLFAAGEQSGLLDLMLERVATYHEKIQAIKGKVRSTLAYPIAILGIAIAVSLLLLWLVVPAFEQSFASFGAALPWPTQLMIDGSNGLRKYGLLLITLISGTGFTLYRSWRSNVAWQTKTDA